MDVTVSSEYVHNTKWAFFHLSLSFFPSFLCWRERHKAQEVDEGRLGGAVTGMHDVKFPNNQ